MPTKKRVSYHLTDIPKDVRDFVLEFQSLKKREKCIIMYGFNQALYEIVRDYKRCSMQEKNDK